MSLFRSAIVICSSIFQPGGFRKAIQLLMIPLCVVFTSTVSAQSNLYSKADVPLPSAFGEPGSLVVSPSMGSVSDSIPIVLPPGRRGMQPGLTLSYNSMAGTGLAGMGWNVTSASIERSRLEGTPARPGCQSEDRYTFSL